MKSIDNISKWLNDEMTPEEFKAFIKTDDYKKYKEIVEEGKNVDLLSLNIAVAHKDFKSRIEKRKKNKTKIISLKSNFLFKVAASILFIVGLTYFFFNFNQTSIKSNFAENKTYTLPDKSSVTLNAVSQINYNKSSFIKKRRLELDGEAFFSVKKGSTFKVITAHGNIQVLGTKFNVKARGKSFKVFCYEGKVSVSYKNNMIVLSKGQGLQLSQDHTLVQYVNTETSSPSWLNNISTFTKEPYSEVLAEFERQFNVKIITNNLDTNILFSGGFDNNDMDSAIKSISLPLNINYSVNLKEGKIVLSK